MAIQITITIPGDAADASTALGRVKQAIDWQYGGNLGGPATLPGENPPDYTSPPQSPAEYRAAAAKLLRDLLAEHVKHTELQRYKAARPSPDDLEVTSD